MVPMGDRLSAEDAGKDQAQHGRGEHAARDRGRPPKLALHEQSDIEDRSKHARAGQKGGEGPGAKNIITQQRTEIVDRAARAGDPGSMWVFLNCPL